MSICVCSWGSNLSLVATTTPKLFSGCNYQVPNPENKHGMLIFRVGDMFFSFDMMRRVFLDLFPSFLFNVMRRMCPCLYCPRARPQPSGPGADPGPALKGQGKGQQFVLGSALGWPWPYWFQIYRENIYISIECRPDPCNTRFIHSSFAFLSLQKGQIPELYCK